MEEETVNFDLSNFIYVPRRPFFFEPVYSFGLLSPVRHRKLGLWSGRKYPTLTDLSASIGLVSDTQRKALAAHQKRYSTYETVKSIVSWFIYLFLGFVFILIWYLTAELTGIIDNNSAFFESLWGILYFFSIFMAYQIAANLATTVLDGYYADTLSFVTALYLLIEIHQEDSLLLPEQRFISLKRVRSLKRNIVLLSYQHARTTSEINSKARDVFSKMENYLEEKEAQILTPDAGSRTSLEMELLSLTEILLTSQYGSFKYSPEPLKEKEVMVSRSSRVFRWIARAVLFLLPLVVLIGLVVYPDRFQFIQPYDNVVALVCLAWLFLAIDANLNLGVVDRAVSLAKTIKELK